MSMWVIKRFPVKRMVSCLSWNVRGLNSPNTQKEVKFLCNNERVDLVELLETKIKSNDIEIMAEKIFGVWAYITNLAVRYNRRI